MAQIIERRMQMARIHNKKRRLSSIGRCCINLDAKYEQLRSSLKKENTIEPGLDEIEEDVILHKSTPSLELFFNSFVPFVADRSDELKQSQPSRWHSRRQKVTRSRLTSKQRAEIERRFVLVLKDPAVDCLGQDLIANFLADRQANKKEQRIKLRARSSVKRTPVHSRRLEKKMFKQRRSFTTRNIHQPTARAFAQQ